MRQVVRAALVVLVGIVSCPDAGAQVLGTIAGSATDASGGVLPGVTVEVSSPALIEKVRSATTDSTGLYRIVNLPPGTYTVSFSLAGFTTSRRDGVEVSPGFTATIDSRMQPGNITETVQVTGESPVVDVQSAAQRRAVTDTQFKELPSGGSWIQMAALTSAVRASNQDVGGILGDQTGAQVSAHGSREGDGVSMVDGLRIGNMYLSSNLTNMSLSPLLFDQVDVQLSGQSAETGTNGVIMNAVPKAGGNQFAGTLLINGTWPGMQGDNLSDRLREFGATSSTKLKTLYDINGALGGPIKQNKLWFYITSRYFTNEYYIAGRFYAADPAAAVFQSSDRQAYGGTYTYDNNGRVTWAINDKQKLSSWYAYQYKVDPHWLIQVFNTAPEAVRVTRWHTQLSTTKWTYVRTNNLLFEAGLAAGASPDTIKTDLDLTGGPVTFPLTSTTRTALVEQATNFNYRAPTNWDWDDRLPSQTFNGSMSYVTGSHNAKFGVEMQRGHFIRGDNNDTTGGIWYTVAQGTPRFVTIQAPLSGWQNNLNYNLGIFAQDQWTLNRLTLSGGVRLDFLNESTEAFTASPHQWLPNRHDSYPAVENVPNWKDVNPRIAAAYDLFGNGKTAIKASASRSVEQDSIRFAQMNNPAVTLLTSTARVWEDNGNFVPDCILESGAAQDNRATGGDLCGAWQTPGFGSAAPATRYDSAIMQGWGERPWNWEFSVGVQHEVVPRVSASIGYFRRIQGNFYVMDNEAYGPNDFTEFSVIAPNNSLLPDSGGYSLGGFFDQVEVRTPQNVIKDASQFGKQKGHWNGFDVSVDARLRNNLYVQGGAGIGKSMSDVCEIVDDVPESLFFAFPPAGQAIQPGIQGTVRDQNGAVQGVGGAPGPNGGTWTSRLHCHQETPWQAQYKALASYVLPWYDIRVSGTWQSIIGPQIAGFTTYSEAANDTTTFSRANLTTLGRPLAYNASVLNVVEPGTAWGDRLNQIDLRFTKVMALPVGRVDLNFDLYNAFNSDARTIPLNSVGPVGVPFGYGYPLQVIPPRFAKLSARWDF
ncbi:MAG TPA: carboxypeptidase regulatory-like domain-containing protein [Vicinamibacterales bacterium]|nr:carboxypeptidase regulatory-like domain-containing protein [Vicinamibacterales bacterium]